MRLVRRYALVGVTIGGLIVYRWVLRRHDDAPTLLWQGAAFRPLVMPLTPRLTRQPARQRSGISGGRMLLCHTERVTAEQPRPERVDVGVQWDNNPYATPQLVNQIQMTTGPDTKFGPDHLAYLRLGHVLPPTGELPTDENGRPVVMVTTVGTFALTKERAAELRDILADVIAQMDQ